MAVFHALQKESLPGLIDIVPAYNSVTLIFDIFSLFKISSGSVHEQLLTSIKSKLANISENNDLTKRRIEVPVCYHETLGIDLHFVASHNKLSVSEVIEIHSAKIYKVYMLGFLPGFAYMASVDDRIATPRKQKPSQNILTGSVGIAGIQTGIYPVNSPGGWQIIGQTPVNLYNAEKENPTFFQPGDEVQFYSIPLQEFHQMKEA